MSLEQVKKHLQGKHPQKSHAPKSGKTAPKGSSLVSDNRANLTNHQGVKVGDVKEGAVIKYMNKRRQLKTGTVHSIAEDLGDIHFTVNVSQGVTFGDKIGASIEVPFSKIDSVG